MSGTNADAGRRGFVLNEAMIRERFAATSPQRGRQSVERGSVGAMVRRGQTIEAEVDGSDEVPHLVTVQVVANDLASAECTCPYDWGGWCKHVVAVLLTTAADPEAAEDRPSLDDLLVAANADQLRSALRMLVKARAVTTDMIESALARANPTATPASSAAFTSPALDAIMRDARREVRDDLLAARQALYDGEYWKDPIDVGGGRARERVLGLLDSGDPDGALAVFDAITDEYVSLWSALDDDDGLIGDIIPVLDPLWAETVLILDLSPSDRERWADTLRVHGTALERSDDPDEFSAALMALEEGWTGPTIGRLLTGKPLPPLRDDIWDGGEAEKDAARDPRLTSGWQPLTAAWLTVLDRQGRTDDYLAVSASLDRADLRAHMLLRLDRPDEALTVGLKGLREPAEALGVAVAFWDRGDVERALRIADHGLRLTIDDSRITQIRVNNVWADDRTALAIWTRDRAGERGETALALRAARLAFAGEPSLSAYLRVRDLAGDEWESLKPELLARVRALRGWHVPSVVDIYLHEGMIDDAIATVVDGYAPESVARVMDAALASHPEWVIATARRQADGIMDRGKSDRYDEAAAWLRRAGEAEKIRGNTAAWRQELDGLIKTHARKYRLRPLLEDLRRRL